MFIPNHSNEDEIDFDNSIEVVDLAFDMLDKNIIEKLSEHLDAKDLLGYELLKEVMYCVANKARAYESMQKNRLN